MDYSIGNRYIRAVEDNLAKIKDYYCNKSRKVPTQLLDDLKYNLNKVFNDSKCTTVIFTDNTDKMFFGMCIMPIINSNELDKILLDDNPFRITHYGIEIDSKLLDPMLDLDPTELTAVILHEIGHLVNTPAPVENVRKELDVYLMKNRETLAISKAEQTRELIMFGLRDAIRKLSSMFENPNKEEIMADKFVISCGYGDMLLSALKKIQDKAFDLNKDVSNKLIVLTWVLRLYKNVGERRIAAIHTLNKAKKITGSAFVKNDIDDTINRLNKLDSVNEAEAIANNQDARAKYRFKYDIMKKYENNYYELALRMKSANLEEDALRLLREINSRISVLEEFLEGSELTDYDRKRFTLLYDKYIDLREALSKKNIVKDRYIGLWVEYPELN